jgi:hypothetical protein
MTPSSKKRPGYVLLLSVLIMSAVGAAVTVSLLLLGLAASRTSFASARSSQARTLADACAEEALEQLRLSSSYLGSGNLTLGAGNCTYSVTDAGVGSRNITAAGTVGTVVRRLSTSVTAYNPYLTLPNWQETAN